MRSLAFAAAFATIASLAIADTPAAPYKDKPGPSEVATMLQTWTDAARNREVPVKVYYPKEMKAPCPLVIFSHGLGGSRLGYEYLGRHWASWGYVVVHVEHLGSNGDAWKGATNRDEALKGMRESLANVRNAVDRPADVKFAIDRMTALNAEDSPFKGRIDLDRIAMAGHSFGAWTTLAVSGMNATALDRMGKSFADPRVKCAIAMSPSMPQGGRLDEAFSTIKIPMLHMTGTLDDSAVNNAKAADRRVPFDRIAGADQYLVTFEGGDHMVFSGRPRAAAGGEKDTLFQGLILQSTTAFLDAYLKGDAKAKEFLAKDGFEKDLGRDGKWEKKLAEKK